MQTSQSLDRMKQVTGHSETSGDMSKELFQLVAILELYSSSYLEADVAFARHHTTSSIVNPPKDRLLCYLQLVSQIKRLAKQGADGLKKKTNSSVSVLSRSQSAVSKQVEIKEVELGDLDISDSRQMKEKLSGATLTDQTIEQLSKLVHRQIKQVKEQEQQESQSILN